MNREQRIARVTILPGDGERAEQRLRESHRLFDEFMRAPAKSTLVPGCSACQEDGMREHYAGIHLAFFPPQRTALVDPIPKPFKQGYQVWADWLKEQLPTEET